MDGDDPFQAGVVVVGGLPFSASQFSISRHWSTRSPLWEIGKTANSQVNMVTLESVATVQPKTGRADSTARL